MNRALRLTVVLSTVACAVILSSPPATADSPADLIRVHVRAATEGPGFVDPDTLDSVKDLEKKIKKKKILRLVVTAGEADIVIEIQRRANESSGHYSTRQRKNYVTGEVIGANTTENTEKVVYAKLIVDDYVKDFVGVNAGFWSKAAGDLANRVEKWVKLNREALLKMRASQAATESASR